MRARQSLSLRATPDQRHWGRDLDLGHQLARAYKINLTLVSWQLKNLYNWLLRTIRPAELYYHPGLIHPASKSMRHVKTGAISGISCGMILDIPVQIVARLDLKLY